MQSVSIADCLLLPERLHFKKLGGEEETLLCLSLSLVLIFSSLLSICLFFSSSPLFAFFWFCQFVPIRLSLLFVLAFLSVVAFAFCHGLSLALCVCSLNVLFSPFCISKTLIFSSFLSHWHCLSGFAALLCFPSSLTSLFSPYLLLSSLFSLLLAFFWFCLFVSVSHFSSFSLLSLTCLCFLSLFLGLFQSLLSAYTLLFLEAPSPSSIVCGLSCQSFSCYLRFPFLACTSSASICFPFPLHFSCCFFELQLIGIFYCLRGSQRAVEKRPEPEERKKKEEPESLLRVKEDRNKEAQSIHS